MAVNKSILNNVRRAIRKIEKSLYPTLKDVFNSNADIVKRLNTEAQLYEGKDSKGLSITPSYARSTISIKLKKAQPVDRVTLKDTDNFYNSFNVIADNNKVTIEATADYAKYLTARYGNDIIGLQDVNLIDFYNKYIKKDIEKNVKTIIRNNKL